MLQVRQWLLPRVTERANQLPETPANAQESWAEMGTPVTPRWQDQTAGLSEVSTCPDAYRTHTHPPPPLTGEGENISVVEAYRQSEQAREGCVLWLYKTEKFIY